MAKRYSKVPKDVPEEIFVNTQDSFPEAGVDDEDAVAYGSVSRAFEMANGDAEDNETISVDVYKYSHTELVSKVRLVEKNFVRKKVKG